MMFLHACRSEKENKQQNIPNLNHKLVKASTDGDLCKVKYTLSDARTDINTRGLHGRTPVMFAAVEAHKDVFDVLVHHGANLALLDDDGNTILHVACKGGNVEIVNYVLTQDSVDVNSINGEMQTPAWTAALHGHKEVFDLLLRKGTDLPYVDFDDNTILHIACKGGNIEIVNYVITAKIVDINTRGFEGYTPVMEAAVSGHKDVFDVLVRRGADLSLFDDQGCTSLHAACRGGNVETVKYILTQNIEIIYTSCSDGSTPVLVAVSNGQKEVFDLLVENEADLLFENENGDGILHNACRGGNIEIVKYILKQSIVDINSRGYFGFTPAMITATRGQKDIFDLLLAHRADLLLVDETGSNILHIACTGGHTGLVNYVLKQNIVDINSRTPEGWTSAMITASAGHKDVLTLLVTEGADLTLVTGKRRNILHIAFQRKHMELVKYILTQDVVDINEEDRQGITPVLLAAESGHGDIFDLMVSKGADLSRAYAEGDAFLHKACEGGNVDILKYVLRQKSIAQDINRKNTGGRTPAMVASISGHKQVLDLLAKEGADLTLLDARHNTILHLASRANGEIVRYFLSHNIVDINSKGENDRTPVMMAASSGCKSGFDVLVQKGANLSLVDTDGSNILHLASLGGSSQVVTQTMAPPKPTPELPAPNKPSPEMPKKQKKKQNKKISTKIPTLSETSVDVHNYFDPLEMDVTPSSMSGDSSSRSRERSPIEPP
ncbi:ankyrin repeat domain-containing protein 50-like [Haliotis rufescens]|uniref:ankyrin repeat domain-containing protein 50-like n=1 Tax=Haliotis rufescens TaxID=6454 RepID=UPI00201FA683|nr:ankyrin repeat domain-containing protein 50-like [Haliotis rufescens]